MSGRNSKIIWNIGRGFQMKEALFKLLDSIDIEYKRISVYDGLSLCKNNAGRFATREKQDFNLQPFYDRGITLNLPLQNRTIDLEDKQMNEALDIFHRVGNGIIITNDAFRKHIRQYYTRYDLSYSITGSYMDEIIFEPEQRIWDYYKEKLDLYDIVVIPKELLEPPLIDKIHCLDTTRLEFVVDNDCYLNCPVVGQIYKNLCKMNKLPPFSKVYWWFYENHTCLDQCWLGDECFDYWYDHKRLQEFIDMDLFRFKIVRHEEYPEHRTLQEWYNYLVDYDRPDENPDKWKIFWKDMDKYGYKYENRS